MPGDLRSALEVGFNRHAGQNNELKKLCIMPPLQIASHFSHYSTAIAVFNIRKLNNETYYWLLTNNHFQTGMHTIFLSSTLTFPP